MPYVSKIELRGFKSFGNSKISIPLSKGLTAIVGPNGTGKSNIVDGLCFVLGEMSAKMMRAERLSGLLFKGGNGHRPAAFAEASIQFNNEDSALPINSQTVTISRRVDRSGNCTYRINDRRASRQEILDLLAATIASPGGYNFVMQGDVNRFVQMGPIDRRLVIDELAGVAEYDEKKQKSMAELDKVETNLGTAGTVLSEISAQMGNLKAQMETALRYRQLKQELEQIQATLMFTKKEACAKKLSALESKIGKLGDEVQTIRGRRQTITDEIDELDEKIRELEDLIEEKQGADVLEEVRDARAQVGALSGLLDPTTNNRSRIEQEIAGLTERIRKLGGPGSETLPDRMTSLMARFNELHEKFNALSKSLDEGKSLAAAKETLHKLKSVLDELAPVVDKLSHQITQLSRSPGPRDEPTAAELRGELAGLRRTHSEMERQIGELQEKIQEARDMLEIAGKSEKEIRASIEGLRAEKIRLRARASDLVSRARALDGKIRELDGKLQGLNTQRAQTEAELGSLKEGMKKLKVETKLSTALDPQALGQKATKIEEEMNSLGEINQRAIRDFRVVEQRHNAEKLKYDKLVAEKQSLLDFMRDIDEKKKDVFMKTFNVISRQFSEIFSELSPGGTGELVLENKEAPFEGGLQIKVRPGGTEVSYMGELSGGQKALTALAFIFALQRYRPTTFYVLDEIDANLDPQNRKRVAEMLRRFSRESQLLVITLHDAMMSVADRLFGVTKENEISHLLSVELSGLGG